MAALGAQHGRAGPLPRSSWARATELRWPSVATLDLLLADLARVLSPWSEGWGLGAVTLRALPAVGHVPSPGHAPDLGWQRVAGPGQGAALAWLASERHEDSPISIMSQALFGDGGGPLARDVAVDAWTELLSVLSEALATCCVALGGEDVGAIEPSVSGAAARRWSGIAQLQLVWSVRGMGTWWLLCRPRPAMADARSALAGVGNAPLASLGQALARRCIRASVSLDAGELPLRALVGMRTGDLVRLSHRLDAPAVVRVGTDTAPCTFAAALARMGFARAAVLIGRTAAPGPSPSLNGDQMSASQDPSAESPSPAQPVARWLDLPAAPVPAPHAPALGVGLHPLLAVRARVEVRVGGFEVTVGELARAPVGAVFALDRGLDDPVDVLVEGSVVARGQLVAVDDCFAVRLTEVPLPLVGAHDGDDAGVR